MSEGNVMGALITIGFVGLVLYVGKRMFSVSDWGKPMERRGVVLDMGKCIRLCDEILRELKK